MFNALGRPNARGVRDSSVAMLLRNDSGRPIEVLVTPNA